MIPSRTWFPLPLQERAAWYKNFDEKAQLTGATLGLSPADLTQIGNDADVMDFLANAAVTQEAWKDGMNTYRRLITTGDIGDPTPPFPANPALALPVVIPTGMFQRLADDYRTRIMASAPYTEEQGMEYGIEPTTSEAPDPAGVQPTIDVSAALIGYLFSIVVAGRAESDMWEVWILPKGAANWSLAKTAVGKSTDVTVAPTTPGEPMVMQVRVQLKKNNANYGQLSDVVYVTVNP